MLNRRQQALWLSLFVCACCTFATQAAADDETYGPVNLLKTFPNPFNQATNTSLEPPSIAGSIGGLSAGPIAIKSRRLPLRSSLAERLVPSRLYLPGRMVLGKPAEFTVKGKPGCYVALAMADRDAGAKPIYDHAIKLGPDRKVVAVGTIPESGVLTLVIETPIEGDLIGQNLFFEAALWKADDFSDLQLATPVTSEGQEGIKNGVLIAAEADQKRGLRIVPDSGVPLQQRSETKSLGLDSGRL